MSKKCLAIAKKAMVWTLAASMLVSTPLTASAAGLRDVYSVSDGWNDDITNTGDESHTGTVTNTDTNTDSGVLKNNELNIMGIVLDKEHVDVEVRGKKQTLTATVVIDGKLYDKNELEKTDEILAQLTKKIKWEVLNPDGTITSDTNKILSVAVTNKGDRSQITLNPRKGTKAGEDMIVRAKIDGAYSFDPENGKIVLTTNATEGFEAEATVSIKEYGDFAFKDIPTQYVKHTLNLNEMVTRDPETANDTITWEILATNPKSSAKINNAGVLTFAKAGTVQVQGTTEKGIQHFTTINIEAGYPVSKILIVDPAKEDSDPAKNVFTNAKNQKNKKDIDLGKDDENPFGVDVVLYSKVKIQDPAKPTKEKTVELREGEGYIKLVDGQPVEVKEGSWSITDDIVWTSNKAATATVDGDNDGASVEALAAGSAVITAKATSNKSAKLTVTVAATMGRDGLSFNWDESTKLYSGQSVDLNNYLVRKPAGNRDALSWSIPKVDGKKVKSASVSGKGVFKVANTVVDEIVEVKVEGKKKYTDEKGDYKPAATVKIAVEQGNIRGIFVTEEETDKVLAKADVNGSDKVVQDNAVKAATKNTTDVSVPKGRTYVASVAEDSKGNASSLVWKHNDSKGKVVEFKDNGDGTVSIKAKAKGKVKVTVSGVYTTKKGTGKAINTSFTINVVQPVETITMAKSLVVINQKDSKSVTGQSQKVSLKATLGPKGVNTKEPITWSIVKISGASDGTVAPTDKKGPITKSSVKFELKKPMTGDIYKVTARTKSGASATTTIKVLEKTNSVVLAKDAEGKETFGKSITMYTGDKEQVFPRIKLKGKATLYEPGENDIEDVEYSLSKKGIVSIDEDGNIYAIKKGNVTVTVKTPTNKKATLKITVKNPLG